MAKADCMSDALSRVHQGVTAVQALGEIALGAWAAGGSAAENVAEVLLYISVKLNADMVRLDEMLCDSGVLRAENAEVAHA